jgi:hypothetical protein
VKLELAIVLACTKTGCRVVPLKDNSPIEARYSSLVQDRIKVQPEQLVAFDTDTNPPEIIWRWLRAAVIELTADIIVIDDMQGHPAKVTLVSDLPLTLTLDDEVWTCGTGHDFEIHDIILDGKPTHPDRLLKYITPIIEKIYLR